MLDEKPTTYAPIDESPVPPAPQAGEDPLKPILVILHQEHSTPAHVGRLLFEQGHPLDIRKPRFGDPLPETLEHHDGAVMFGGPMSVLDGEDFIKQETDWIGVALREDKPFLGICLGAQMLADHLGAGVFRGPDGRVEIGYHDVEPLAQATRGIAWPRKVFQWHKDGFELPTGARCLASGPEPFPVQAFSYGSGLAIQFHPEITLKQVHRWSGKNAQKLLQPGAQDRPSQLRNHLAHAPGIHRWMDALLRDWKRAPVA